MLKKLSMEDVYDLSVSAVLFTLMVIVLSGCKQYSVKVHGDTKHTVKTETSGEVKVIQSGESKTVIEYRVDVSLCSEIKRALDQVNPDDPSVGSIAEANCLAALIKVLGEVK